MHCSLSFAMQRVCFQTKRFFAAANRGAEVALNNFGMHVVDCRRKTRLRWQLARRATATKRRRE